MDPQEFNEAMSFQELYNEYYILQMKNCEIPMIKAYFNIQEGILNRLNDSTLKKLGAKKETLFLPWGNSNQIDLFKKESNLNYKNGQMEKYSVQINDQISSLKNTIISKLEKHLESDTFQINLDLLSKPNGESAELEPILQNIAINFSKINSENALGLYYIMNGDIPFAEFFKEKYGFTLKIAEFPEVKKRIASIRELNGIKTPRDLVNTINEEGRIEMPSKKASYVVMGEREIYGYLNQYLTSNFGVPANSIQGIAFPVEDHFVQGIFCYDNLIVKRKTSEDLTNKWGWVWTGDIYISPNFKRDAIKDNFIIDSPISLERSSFGYGEIAQEFIEKFCASCLDKFAEKNLASKLKIRMDKKYF